MELRITNCIWKPVTWNFVFLVDFIICDTDQSFWWIRTFWTNALSPSSRSFRLCRRTLHIYFKCKHPLRIVHNCTAHTTLIHTSMRTSNLTALYCRICSAFFENLILQTCHIFHIKAINRDQDRVLCLKTPNWLGNFLTLWWSVSTGDNQKAIAYFHECFWISASPN